ncbi:MAG: putative glutamine amidotransferase [Chthonomonadales bacterium]|nr:putative glutamine amidotransferase [Chthonomonadales bacterium]
MSRKIVGILGSTSTAKEDFGPKQYLNRAYVWAVESAGGIPIMLPVTRDPEAIGRYLGLLDGLLISGGVDVDPACFGEAPHPKLGTVDDDRDTTELPLIREALAQDTPVFAICRGIQSLNVALGGSLYQDIPSQKPSDIHHQQSDLKIPRNQTSHAIHIVPDSRLHHIVGQSEMQTNSFHHQALKKVSDGLIVTAYAPDDIIEAAESPTHRYVVAVQFHPEETAPNDLPSRQLFESFIAAL